MFESAKLTRIGDILVERGIISRHQLMQALDIQQERKLFHSTDLIRETRSELGEILIELGFISRDQLKKNLARQNRLRKTTIAITFVAPLFTMACGGGGGGASSPKNGQSVASTVSVEQASSEQKSSTPPQSPVSSSSSSSGAVQGQLSGNSSSAINSSMNNQVSSQQQSSAQTSSLSATTGIDGPVLLYWTAPTRRMNGNLLDLSELGGYEIRYKLRDESTYTYINIPGGYTDSYYFNHMEGDYEFQIAAYDVTGIYSTYIPINPR